MEKIKIGINGFGRIGRLIFRMALEQDQLEVVAINDLISLDYLAYLMKYDSTHGRFTGTIEVANDELIVNGKSIRVTAEKDPANLAWGDIGAQYIVEATGFFLTKEKANAHIEAGAKKVVMTAPSKDDTPMFVMGVNHEMYESSMNIVSNASCTTNCLAPVCKILTENFTVVKGSMSTIHGYTADQNIQDAPHSDLRRARAAAINIVPTTTGAAIATAMVVPAIKDKLTSMAFRVPIPTGSVIELNVLIEETTDVDRLKALFKKHADTDMKGILEYSTDPLVSCDIVGNKHSSILDSQLINVMDGNLLKIVSWYDNEAGYSARLAQLVAK